MVADLEALAAEQATTIYKAAVKSGKIKETMTKGVKKAAATMCAAATALAIKAQNPVDISRDRQVEALRARIKKLQHEKHTLELLLDKHKTLNKRQKIISSPTTTDWGNVSWDGTPGTLLPSEDGEAPGVRTEEALLPPRRRDRGISSLRERKGRQEEATHLPEDREASI
ncbi:cobyrinic acid -diamide synthase [Lasius niger]|uniref:Cobyrinic acid-diamide synthase n=1 Tax=Lasius niger TaxID=67767 RepID=A0A0J7K506_LASNI|nr:cobyrinic acid -diamide synthase [Lasius niger]